MKQQNKPAHLTYGLRCANDLFEKLKRDGDLLEQEVSSDRFFNFVVTAYHLCEWVEKDRSIEKSVRGKRPTPQNNQYIAICRDIANASKHFMLNKPSECKAITAEVDSKQAYGEGRYGRGSYGQGEEAIKIKLANGNVIGALNFKNCVVGLWTSFFSEM